MNFLYICPFCNYSADYDKLNINRAKPALDCEDSSQRTGKAKHEVRVRIFKDVCVWISFKLIFFLEQ